MGVEFNVLTSKDYYERARKVEVPIAQQGMSAFDLVSPAIFGSRHYEAEEDRTLQTYHMRGYIQLVAPVINEIVAGKDGRILANILGWKPKDMASVLKFEGVLDGGEWVPKNEMPSECLLSDIMMGPQAIAMEVNSFNIHDEFVREMENVVKAFHKKKKADVRRLGNFSQNSGQLPVIGNWYYNPPSGTAVNYDGWQDWMFDTYFNHEYSRLVYLYNLDRQGEDGYRRLRSTIMDKIMVVPIDMRPGAKGQRTSRLTKMYGEVMKQNDFLSLVLHGYGSIDSAAAAYQSLQNAVRWLTDHHNKVNAGDKSIMEAIKTKHGHIRDKMLGKRIDYSGRSVITIDPFMSIRDIGVPKDMIPKLYRSAILRSMPNPDLHRYIGTSEEKNRACMRRVQEAKLLDKIPVITGRQPTLHKPSMRAFHPKVTNDRSLHLNPLSVIGFNADFDGDQMYVRVPISDEAIEESNRLMRIEQNMFLPKNGECSVMPRQEIIYGLNVCTRPQAQTTGRMYSNWRELFDAIFTQECTINSFASCEGYSGTAGRVAFLCCVAKGMFSDEEWQTIVDMEVTAKSIKFVVNRMVNTNANLAIDYIDRMVELGFRVAATYPPTLNLLDDEDISYAAEMKEFHDTVEEDVNLYNMGWETDTEFDRTFNTAFEDCVEKKVKPRVESDIGEESGFVRMVKSGARGSSSNLLQMYGYKGRVVDGATGGAFRTVIEHSYVEQLTPLEHFVTAYGGRAGLIQKSLNTADSGYTMRKMWHTTSPYHIVCEDCGSKEGLTISRALLASTYGKDADIEAIFVDMVTGRYEAGTDKYITAADAKRIAQDKNFSITIRSVLTCKNPCCKKCYGIDLSTNRVAQDGLPVGFIAAQSIGEPGTQLNMDAFKKGGVASGGASKRLSGFHKLQAYTETADLHEVPSYDPVAWATGVVNEIPKSDGTKTVTISGATGSVTLPADVMLRDEVMKGEGMRLVPGDQDINELVKYGNLLDAQRYLCLALYSVYKDEGGVNIKHFEVLAAAMTMHMIMSTDQKDFVPGQWHDSLMLNGHDLSHTTYKTELKSVKQVQQLRPYALSKIIMEDVKAGLSAIALFGLTDPLTYPLNRIMMGLPAWGQKGRDK